MGDTMWHGHTWAHGLRHLYASRLPALAAVKTIPLTPGQRQVSLDTDPPLCLVPCLPHSKVNNKLTSCNANSFGFQARAAVTKGDMIVAGNLYNPCRNAVNTSARRICFEPLTHKVTVLPVSHLWLA